MKKYYYFSKSKLKFIEVQNYRTKFAVIVTLTSVLFAFILVGIYFILNGNLSSNVLVKQLRSENRLLKNQLIKAEKSLIDFSDKFDSLSRVNNDLRLATNLEPLTEKDRKVGIGGAAFNKASLTNEDEVNSVVGLLDSTIQAISVKIELEKKNYEEIKNTLAYNSKLYDAIPAIKPAAGNYGDRFGMRYHPILKIRRMHNGLDILSYYNTPVYAPGSGVVEFVGRKGGYGKTIVINHGFGYKTVYGHLNKYKVKKGQRVKRGDLIALTGSSGSLSTGPHLHYEVKHNGIALNPRNFIFDDVKIFEFAQNLNKE